MKNSVLKSLYRACHTVLGNRRGFTILELIVAMAITVILGIGAITMYVNVQNYVLETKMKNEQAMLLTSITQILQEELAYAQAGTIDFGGFSRQDYGFKTNNDLLKWKSPTSNTITLLDATSYNHHLSLLFKNYSGDDTSTFSEGCILYVDVTISADGTDYETTKEIAIRLLNYPLSSNASDKILGSSAIAKDKIGYNIA